MAIKVRVLSLNCWALPLKWPFGSSDHLFRLKKLEEALLESHYDFVALEEVWCESDFLQLREVLEKPYPFGHYFHSGFTGSGICVFSRHRIVSTLMYRFTLNGFAHHIHRGDWFGGKGVGLVQVEIEQYQINFYVAHLHAEYNQKNDSYLPHRLAQAFELAQFVKHTSCSADVLILMGDFNIEPDDLAYSLIMKNANLLDAWVQKPNFTEDCGATYGRADNCYTPQSQKNKGFSGQRLDYVMYRRVRSNIETKLCEIALNCIPGEKLNYSDHVGICAEFVVSDHHNSVQITKELSPVSSDLLKEVIQILEQGLSRITFDRRIFFGFVVLLALINLLTFFLDIYFPSIKVGMQILRFFFTLLIGFCVWYSCIGLTLEHKALKASKASINMLLND
ncbi:unnamed protein product [Thelazia callipaeda]|uniref:sphingomyelin phosphodiesterase n=1 Tax=Thelazia callipaeda TaxID=103827 RepID=A0A0N5CXL6_THECL|nr:unnamed protein product [Thelazia callipaeda]